MPLPLITMEPPESIAVIGTVDPVASITADIYTNVIDMAKFDRVIAVFMSGAANATFLAATAYACDSDGSNAAALKTQNATATDISSHQVVMEVKNNDLAGTSKHYVKFGIGFVGDGGFGAVVVLGKSKYGPDRESNLASVITTHDPNYNS